MAWFAPKTITWAEVAREIFDTLQEEENYAVAEPIKYFDEFTGNAINITSDPFYSIFSVNNRDYFFQQGYWQV